MAQGKKRDEELEQVRRELQSARAQGESIRDDLQEKVEESLAFAAKAAEAHAARADAERRLADTQEAVTGKQSVRFQRCLVLCCSVLLASSVPWSAIHNGCRLCVL